MKLDQSQRSFLRLVDRSMKGEQWAKVSDTLWPLTQKKQAGMPELVELDAGNQCVRLTDDGRTVLAWL